MQYVAPLHPTHMKQFTLNTEKAELRLKIDRIAFTEKNDNTAFIPTIPTKAFVATTEKAALREHHDLYKG